MSPRYSITPAAAMKDTRLSLVAKALIGLLGTYTDKNGWCHPKQADLARSLRVSREYVSRTLRTLIQLGYVETRSFTASRRGRVALEYRVRTDLSDEIVQAAENSRCEPDVIQSSHRPSNSLKSPDVIQSSHRGRCEQEITADVNRRSHRNIMINDPIRTTPESFPEAWQRWPRKDRSSKAKSREAWTKAEKAHSPEAVLSAFDAYLGSPDARKSNSEFVPAMERWLRDKLEAWIEISAGKPAAVADDWADAHATWRASGFWDRIGFGPAPNEPGYRGPPIATDLITLAGGKP